jgi:hypothetical protein
MKAYDYEAVTWNSSEYCKTCLPDDAYGLLVDKKQRKANPDAEVPSPIFASAELSHYPVCFVCHEKHTYMSLNSEGRAYEMICDECGDPEEDREMGLVKQPKLVRGREVFYCQYCNNERLEEEIFDLLDEEHGWIDLGSDYDPLTHGGMWMRRVDCDEVFILCLATMEDSYGSDVGSNFFTWLRVFIGYFGMGPRDYTTGLAKFTGLRFEYTTDWEQQPPELVLTGFSTPEGDEVPLEAASQWLLAGVPNYGGGDVDFSYTLKKGESLRQQLLEFVQANTPTE